MTNDIQFVTILKSGGDFNPRHVEWLQQQVNIPIMCLTDSTIPMKNVTSIPLKYNLTGWWSKLEAFRPDIGLTNFFYADLDTIFLNGLPEKYTNLPNSVVLSNIARVHNDSIYSGLMWIVEKDKEVIWNNFIKDRHNIMEKFKSEGDQGYLNLHLAEADKWQTLFPNEIVSYKTDILRKGFTGEEQIVLFHAKPRPWHVVEKWIPKL